MGSVAFVDTHPCHDEWVALADDVAVGAVFDLNAESPGSFASRCTHSVYFCCLRCRSPLFLVRQGDLALQTCAGARLKPERRPAP